jgi:hypothetical protein
MSFNTCLSVGLVHSLHRSSSRVFPARTRVFTCNSGFSSNSPTLQNVLVLCTPCTCSMPSWQSSTECSTTLCYAYSCTDFPPRYSTTLRFPLSCELSLVCPPGTFFSDSKEFRYTLLALAHRVSTLCRALLALSLKNPEQFNKTHR